MRDHHSIRQLNYRSWAYPCLLDIYKYGYRSVYQYQVLQEKTWVSWYQTCAFVASIWNWLFRLLPCISSMWRVSTMQTWVLDLSYYWLRNHQPLEDINFWCILRKSNSTIRPSTAHRVPILCGFLTVFSPTPCSIKGITFLVGVFFL